MSYVGFGLAKLEKAVWHQDRHNDTILSCPYKWTIYHKCGTIEEFEGKIDTFWSLMCLKKGEGKGIKLGPAGYLLTVGVWDWNPVPDVVEFTRLMEDWMDKFTTPEVVKAV